MAFVRLPPALVENPAALGKRSYNGLVHVSDIMPTVLGMVDAASGASDSDASTLPRKDGDERWARGEGYDLSQMLLAGDELEASRPDVLMAYDVPTNKTGYRWGKWKLIAGNPGDSRHYAEPTDDSEWIGSSFSDYVTESLMYFGHWADEDASGTLDEVSGGVGGGGLALGGRPLHAACASRLVMSVALHFTR